MPTITQLEYIIAVAQYKHFGKASQHCNVSQPSLSMQIQKAEEELGILIFDRNKKPIEITKKGEIVLQQAQKMIFEYKKLLQVSRQETEVIKGDFHLAVIPTLSSSVIPLFVKSFSKNYPEVQLFISEMTTSQIIDAIKLDEIDVGLLATPVNEPTFVKKVLFYEGFSVYCSSDHPLLKKKTLNIKDLLDHHDLWILSDGHCFKNQVLNFCGFGTQLEVFPNIHFQSGSLETLKRLVEESKGYTFLPQLNIDQLSAHEKKKIRQFKSSVPSREVSLVYHQSHWKKDIIDALHQEILKNSPDSVKKNKPDQLNIIEIT